MRSCFTDLKKFWESHLGGSGRRSSLSDKLSLFKANDGVVHSKKKANADGDRSIQTNIFGRRSHHIVANYTDSSSVKSVLTTLPSDLQSGVGKSNKFAFEDKQAKAKVKNPEANLRTRSGIELRNQHEKPTQVTTSHILNSSPVKVNKVVNKTDPYSRPVRCDKRNCVEKYSSDIEHSTEDNYDSYVPEKLVIKCENGILSSKQKNNQRDELAMKHHDLSFLNSYDYSNCNKSDPHLNASVDFHPTCSFPSDRTSAPPSVNSSPMRRVKLGNGAQSFPSNVKFNEVQNFWKMREMERVNRYTEERRCCMCSCYLNNSFYQRENFLYCEEDYWKKYGQCCKKCDGIVTGPIMIAGCYRFHPECFECNCCKRCISDGDLYAILLDSNAAHQSDTTLFCAKCYHGLLSEYTVEDDCSANVTTYTVITVVDFYPVKSFARKQEDVTHMYKKGYGITIRDPPMFNHLEGTNQHSGQIVCGVDTDVGSSLQVGDILLQVNGLAVDLNALDLIDRLYDDSQTALQITIQREMNLASKMCDFCDYCAHFTPVNSPCDYDVSSRGDVCTTQKQEFTFEKPQVIQSQPLFPDLCIEDKQNDDAGNLIQHTPDDSGVETQNDLSTSYCGPFSFSATDTLCCDVPPTKAMSLDVRNEDSPATSSCKHDRSSDSLENLTDSGVEGNDVTSEVDTGQTFELNEDLQLKTVDNSSRSSGSLTSCISDTKGFHESDDSLGKDNLTESHLTDSPCSTSDADNMIIDTNVTSPSVAAASESDASDHYSRAENQSHLNSELESNQATLSAKPPSNSTKSRRVNRSLRSARALEDESEEEIDLPPRLSPRAERHGIRRKTANKKLNSIKHDSARRSNSLRKDVSIVVVRKAKPRAQVHVAHSTFSVYNYATLQNTGADLSRSESMKLRGPLMDGSQRVFRSCDLIHGEVLGQGFFGKAIKVTHRDTGEVMVLKELNSLEPMMEQSFLKEVKVMRNLFHRNLLRFIGVLYKDKRLNIISEYISCGTLKGVLANMEEELSWQQRASFARDISSGMMYLHSMMIIHRDLNSGNCFVKEDGTVVVADFGLARVLSRSASLGRRKRYTMVGNPFWMAPEMLCSKVYDEKVDVFSFGIVLCEIIGRVDGNPDLLPRSNDFGLAVLAFYKKFCDNCPAYFFALAVHASDMNPDKRPSFIDLDGWFEMMVMREELPSLPEPPNLRKIIVEVYVKYALSLPSDLYKSPEEIENARVKSTGCADASVANSSEQALTLNKLNSTVKGTGFFTSTSSSC